jgi:hypothetical protein
VLSGELHHSGYYTEILSLDFDEACMEHMAARHTGVAGLRWITVRHSIHSLLLLVIIRQRDCLLYIAWTLQVQSHSHLLLPLETTFSNSAVFELLATRTS